ncbi:hypothetical protein WJX72_002400 [[Myrmecia] bisecta]|uniref:Trafficking protein particle complex subunit 2-like protein n=1 Tax=[Myrmecia] bisecta TaxID=41462 RepID=A0AAW1QQ57_9CHLO
MIVCAAVIGQANNPLYLETFQPGSDDDALKFHYIVHCSLDAVDEKVAMPKKSPADTADPYLGMLYPTEDYKVYGYISNTKMKFILVLDEPVAREDDMRMIFKRFHTAYVDAVSNPFYTGNTPITSPSFDASVRAIVSTPV